MNAAALKIHTLKTPTGRNFQVSIAPDGTRVIAAHFHRSELVSISVALDAARERMHNMGNCADQRRFEELRDLFLGALHHDA